MPLTAVVDVHYAATRTRAAAVLAEDARLARVVGERVVDLPAAAAYEPGRFALRELPAIRAVLAGVDGLALLVVDGYADLAPGRPGLGAYAHAELGVPVVGIAKTPYRGATHAARVVRGSARRPLYVTAAGLGVAEAAALVRDLAGPYRLPDAVRRADALARGHDRPRT